MKVTFTQEDVENILKEHVLNEMNMSIDNFNFELKRGSSNKFNVELEVSRQSMAKHESTPRAKHHALDDQPESLNKDDVKDIFE